MKGEPSAITQDARTQEGKAQGEGWMDRKEEKASYKPPEELGKGEQENSWLASFCDTVGGT